MLLNFKVFNEFHALIFKTNEFRYYQFMQFDNFLIKFFFKNLNSEHLN